MLIKASEPVMLGQILDLRVEHAEVRTERRAQHEHGSVGRAVLLDVQSDLPLFRYFLDARSPDESWSFEHVQHLGGIGPVRARVLEGAGVAVLPLYYVERDIRAGRLRRLFPNTKLPSDWFRLIWRKGHPQSAALRELAAELAQLPLR